MSIALSGYYDACCVVIAAPAEHVATMLSDKLVLDPAQTLAPPGQHAFVILMGAHRDVAVKFIPGKWNYREALIAIPWVQRKEAPCGKEPLAYNEHLWLDKLIVVLGGWLWGFPKIWSRVEIPGGDAASCDAYAVRSLLGKQLILEGQFKDRGTAGPPDAFANFAAVRPVFEQMFIQRFLLTGPLILSHLDFELNKATLQPIDAEVEYKGKKYSVPGLDESSLGAFRISLPWTLTWPFSCSP